MTTPDATPLVDRSAEYGKGFYPLAYHALRRDVDPAGVSGTGTVAYAIELTTGVLLVWDTNWVTVDWRPNMSVLDEIHGHGGTTRIERIDPRSPDAARARHLLTAVLPHAIVTHAQAVSSLAA